MSPKFALIMNSSKLLNLLRFNDANMVSADRTV